MSTKPRAPRATKQRAAITAALLSTREFRTAQQWFEELRSRGERVGLATVYRTLQSMVETNEVDVRRTDDGEALYRLCAEQDEHSHHFHLVCRQCGDSVELDDAEIEQWAHSLASTHGYSDVSHTIEIFGTCARCAKRATSAAS